MPIRNPQKMAGPRVVSPLDQVSQHYGGRSATLDALLEARQLANELSGRTGADAANYRQMFPMPNYSGYTDPMLINPIPSEMLDAGDVLGDPDAGIVTLPDDPTAQDGLIQMETGDLIEAPSMASDMPTISFAQERPRKMAYVDTDPSEADLDPEGDLLNQFEAQRAKQGLRRGEIGRSVEMPMTEYLTMSPEDLDARQGSRAMTDYGESYAGPTQMAARTMGREIDPVLGQIRRASGATQLGPLEAEELIQGAVNRANFVGDMGQGVVDATTGLTMDKLQMLAQLPPEVRAMLPQRIRELLSLGGITTGLLSQGGQQDRPQSINPRSTMGPLGGLTDF
jgi:hypothetical protein